MGRRKVRFSGKDSLSDSESPQSNLESSDTKPTRSILKPKDNECESPQVTEDIVIKDCDPKQETDSEQSIEETAAPPGETNQNQTETWKPVVTVPQKKTVFKLPVQLGHKPTTSQSTADQPAHTPRLIVKSSPVSQNIHLDGKSGQYFRTSKPEPCDAIEVRVFELQQEEKVPSYLDIPVNFDLTSKQTCCTPSTKGNKSKPKNLISANPKLLYQDTQEKPNLHLQTYNSLADSPPTSIYTSSIIASNSVPYVSTNRTDNLTALRPVHQQSSLASEDSGFASDTLPVTMEYEPEVDGPPRVQEKHQLQDLNDRLATYISHVRHMKEQAGPNGSAAFLQSIKTLEEELMQLKETYERELDTVRHQADCLGREKHFHELNSQKVTRVASELENKLSVEADKNKQAMDQLNSLHQIIARREAELREARMALQEPMQSLEAMQRDYDHLVRENEILRKRYETEFTDRQAAQDSLHTVKQKMEFDQSVHEREENDLKDRLEAADQTILELETRVKHLQCADGALSNMLTRVRDAADAELQKYQEESSESFNRNLTALKIQIDEDAIKIENLTETNLKLNMEVGELTKTIRALEGKVQMLDHQRLSLEDLLNEERKHAGSHIHILEKKVKEFQDMLITKMREVNHARDAQIPLKAEIEAFKALLNEEERRLRIVDEMAPKKPINAFGSTPIGPLNSSKHNQLRLSYTATNGPSKSQVTASPMGPVRARSAPAIRQRGGNLVSTSLGTGRDYFDEMFKNLENPGTPIPNSPKLGSPSTIRPANPEPPTPGTPIEDNYAPNGYATDGHTPTPPVQSASTTPVNERPVSSTQHDYTSCTSSATGEIKIHEIDPHGKFIRLVNTSNKKDEEVGSYLLQQNVGGHPVAVYRFPARLTFKANSYITVWSGSNEPHLHQPPNDLVFNEQLKWGTGPECTTILCKGNGQAIAWMTAAHRFTQDMYASSKLPPYMPHQKLKLDGDCLPDPVEPECPYKGDPYSTSQQLSDLAIPMNAPKEEPVYLKREKVEPPSLVPPQSPFCSSTLVKTHPHVNTHRVEMDGNNNSSLSRQSRSHSQKPDQIPGAPYAGASAQKMGSASLRKYTQPTIRGSGKIANQALEYIGHEICKEHERLRKSIQTEAGHIRYGPPSPFLSPLQQDYSRALELKNTSLVPN